MLVVFPHTFIMPSTFWRWAKRKTKRIKWEDVGNGVAMVGLAAATAAAVYYGGPVALEYAAELAPTIGESLFTHAATDAVDQAIGSIHGGRYTPKREKTAQDWQNELATLRSKRQNRTPRMNISYADTAPPQTDEDTYWTPDWGIDDANSSQILQQEAPVRLRKRGDNVRNYTRN